MPGERYVLLGLAPARSPWFGALAHWATSGAIPADFVKCVSAEELRARLTSGRPFSAVLVDAGMSALDRDLVEMAGTAGCPVVAVADHRARVDWEQLGVGAVLPHFFDPEALLDALEAHAPLIARGDALPGDEVPDPPPAWRGQVAMVCGAGGTGASTAAVALAQGLAEDPRQGRSVVLADLALRAEQAMLHDARDVVPSIQELVEEHRSRRLSPEEVRGLAFDVEERGYHLLLGLRQARAWSAVRPRAFEAAFDSLQASYRVVVCDADADLEGEEEGGSVDVEERNVMARTAAARADVVFAVGLPGMKGLYSLVRVLTELQGFGVPPQRIVPVVNRVPRGVHPGAEAKATLSSLLGSSAEGALAPPVLLPDRRVEDVLRDGTRLPAALTEPLARTFAAVAEVARTYQPAAGRRVQPGSLGWWAGHDGAEEVALG